MTIAVDLGCKATIQTNKQNKQNNKISVFRVTGLNFLGRIGTYFLNIFFSGFFFNFMHFERHFAFQNA